MGYTTYVSGELQFDRRPTEPEIQKIKRLLEEEPIAGELHLADGGDRDASGWIVEPDGQTSQAREMVQHVTKLCQQADELGLKLTGELYLKGADDDDISRIRVKENQVEEMYARICWPDTDWVGQVNSDLEAALREPPGTTYIERALGTIKQVFGMP